MCSPLSQGSTLQNKPEFQARRNLVCCSEGVDAILVREEHGYTGGDWGWKQMDKVTRVPGSRMERMTSLPS